VEYVLFVLSRAIVMLVVVLDGAMLLRAIFSLLGIDEETAVGALLYDITEPLIMPVRALLERLGWFQGLPIDMSFLFTSLLLNMLLMVVM
jgi:YggT family protein